MSTSTLVAPGRAEFRRGDLVRMTQTLAKADPDQPAGTIAGTACLYGVEVARGYGLFLQLEPGCFAEQVPHASRVKVLWQHQDDNPIGKLSELADSAERLRFLGRISENPAIPDAARALALLREEILEEVSVGFRILKWVREETESESESESKVLYRILQAHLEEISPVTWGAMGPAAAVDDVWSGRNGSDLAAVEARARAAKARAEMERATALLAGAR